MNTSNNAQSDFRPPEQFFPIDNRNFVSKFVDKHPVTTIAIAALAASIFLATAAVVAAALLFPLVFTAVPLIILGASVVGAVMVGTGIALGVAYTVDQIVNREKIQAQKEGTLIRFERVNDGDLKVELENEDEDEEVDIDDRKIEEDLEVEIHFNNEIKISHSDSDSEIDDKDLDVLADDDQVNNNSDEVSSDEEISSNSRSTNIFDESADKINKYKKTDYNFQIVADVESDDNFDFDESHLEPSPEKKEMLSEYEELRRLVITKDLARKRKTEFDM